MPVDRSKRVKNMFAAPKTVDLVTGDPVAPVAIPLKQDETIEIPPDVIEVTIDDIIKTEDQVNNNQLVTGSPLVESLAKPSIKEKKDKTDKTDMKDETVIVKPTPSENSVTKKAKVTEATKFIGPNVHIGCRVSNEMKNAIEDMAKDFAYLARKEYGLKIKDDCSSIQRAFLILGMNCFTEKIRHKILQDYDDESLMQDEVSKQLLALMRSHNVEIDDIDF